MPRRPTMRRARPADRYASPGESIYEFHDGHSGGLISLRRIENGHLLVEVYRTDPDVEVRTSALSTTVTGDAQ